jgi:type IV pilus assembly protein PilQ
MSTRTLFATLAALALAAAGFAQTAPAAPAPAAPAAAQPKAADAVTVQGAEAAKTAGTATRDKDTLSVDFPDEDIKTILRNVADLFELNLVVPDTLTGKTSIKLRDVTWRQIFKVVLDPVGYTYIEEGNIIKIISKDTLEQEPTVTEVIILNNAKAADIKPTIDGLIDSAKGGKLLVEARSNALVVTERPSRITHIRATIEQLDKATDQVMIESKFVEVADSDIRNIGVNWTSLNGMQFGVNKVSQGFLRGRDQQRTNGNTASNGTSTNSTNGNTSNTNNTNGSTTLNGTNATTTNPTRTTTTTNTSSTGSTVSSTSTNSGTLLTYDAVTGNPVITPIPAPGAVNTLSTTTAPSSSSSTTVTNVSGTSTGGTNSSTNNTVGSNVTDTITSGLTTTGNNVISQLTGLTNTATTSRLASAVFNASDFNIIISALKTQANTKIVSNPTVVTLNNIEATINVGEEDPIPHYAFNQQTGTYEVTGFDTMKIGVLLKVTPQVNARGIINLKLAPEVSQKAGTANFGQAQIPIKATRSVTTQVALKNGNTVGLGGLMTNNRQHGGTKVPILGDIPGLGRLFSSKSVNDTATNLLIFVTARTVNAEGASPEEVFGKEALDAIEYTPAKKAGK